MTEVRPQVRELLEFMDERRSALLKTVAEINSSLASIRPRSGAWSAAENLAHLAKVEAGVARLAERSVEWARRNGIGPALSDESVLSSLDRYRVTETQSKMVAPEMVVPSESSPIEESLESLQQSRARLREALIAGADLDLASLKRPHQALGELNLLQWALFVAQHEERHRRQIDRAMEEVTERAAECAPIV